MYKLLMDNYSKYETVKIYDEKKYENQKFSLSDATGATFW